MSTTDSAFGFGTPFQAQIEYLRNKLRLPTERWDDITGRAHDRAFIVAGAAKADLLADLHQAVIKSATDGAGLQAFRKDFKAIVAKNGWTGWTGEGTKAGEAWRTRVIYQTNMATSYSAGRYQQMTDPEVLALHPYWRYIHSDGVLNPRQQHLAWHGLTLRHDHPFWRTHWAPNGFGCHCRITSVTRREGEASERAGLGDPPAGWDAIDPKTGEQVGITKGFGFAPGENVKASLQSLIDDKLIKLDAPIGAAMWEVLKPVMLAEKSAAFSDFVDTTLAGPVRGKTFVAGALKSAWIEAAVQVNLTPATAEIVVRDADVWHTFRDAKTATLDLTWYKQLPTLLDQPMAVILDQTHPDAPAYLLFYDTGETGAKLVVRVNYRIKKFGLSNIVETGKIINFDDVKPMIGKGYVLIEGYL
jgi:Phage Mu protein F like protein